MLQCIWLSEEGVMAVSGSWDGTLRVWNVETGICKQLLISHTEGNSLLEVCVYVYVCMLLCLCGGAVVQWCDCVVVQWCDCVVVQWCDCVVVQWCDCVVVQWCDCVVVQWCDCVVVQWCDCVVV